MSYLFDCDAVSEPFKRRPLERFLEWIRSIERREQFTSAVVIGELYQGAYLKADAVERHLLNIERDVMWRMTVLPFDTSVAKIYGQISSVLRESGLPLEDTDVQIAATAMLYDLELVTGNLRHFARIPGLRIHTALVDARADGVSSNDCEPGLGQAGAIDEETDLDIDGTA